MVLHPFRVCAPLRALPHLVWVSVWIRDSPAPQRCTRSRRRTIVGPNAARGLAAPPYFVCRSRLARVRETSARGGEQSVIFRVGSAGEATASRATASCSSTSTWTRTSSWSRGTSGRTCRRCCERSSRTRCVHGSIRWVGRDARSTNPKKMRGEKDRRFFFFRIGDRPFPRRAPRLAKAASA